MVKKKIIVPKLNYIPNEPVELLIEYDIVKVPVLDPKKIGITLYGFKIKDNINNKNHYLFYKKNNITIYLQRSSDIIKDKIYFDSTKIKGKLKYKDIFELSVKSLIKIDQSLNR